MGGTGAAVVLVMKNAITVALLTCFVVLAAANGQAEEYYVYRNPNGGLVISNKLPPAGSDMLRKLELPEVPQDKAQAGEAAGLASPDESAARTRRRQTS
jgi:hypothetical protein